MKGEKGDRGIPGIPGAPGITTILSYKQCFVWCLIRFGLYITFYSSFLKMKTSKDLKYPTVETLMLFPFTFICILFSFCMSFCRQLWHLHSEGQLLFHGEYIQNRSIAQWRRRCILRAVSLRCVCSQNELKGERGDPGLKGEKGEPGGHYGSPYGGVQGQPGPPVRPIELLFVVLSYTYTWVWIRQVDAFT